jgi:hypothetical protein
MVAIFEMNCCRRPLAFGRFKGNETSPPTLNCNVCKKDQVQLHFVTYIDERQLGVEYSRYFFLNDNQKAIVNKSMVKNG